MRSGKRPARHFVTVAAVACTVRALISSILLTLALLSVLLNLWQWYAAGRFHFARIAVKASPQPGVSILRPLKDCDSETESCLRSWFTQEYEGESELLFGVASETDPVCEIVRRLIEQ